MEGWEVQVFLSPAQAQRSQLGAQRGGIGKVMRNKPVLSRSHHIGQIVIDEYSLTRR